MCDRRQIDDLAVAHAAFGDDMVGELLHFSAGPLQDRHLHATFVVEMNMQRRLREVVVIVKIAREPLRQFALVMVVDVDQSREAVLSSGRPHRVLLQAGSREIADRFRAIGVTARRMVDIIILAHKLQ